MQPRSHYSHSNFGQNASARRRIRRTSAGNRLFCSTNGCATYLQPDASGTSATCPVCGARRTLALIARSQSGVMTADFGRSEHRLDHRRRHTHIAPRGISWSPITAASPFSPGRGASSRRTSAGSRSDWPSADGRSAAQVLIRPYRGLAVAYVRARTRAFGGRPNDRALVDAVIKLARSRRAAFVRFEPDGRGRHRGDGRTRREPLARAGFRTSERTLQPRSSIRLDLTPTEDELMAAFSKGHRADIRRAERDGVTIRVGDDRDRRRRAAPACSSPPTSARSFGFHSAAYYRRAAARVRRRRAAADRRARRRADRPLARSSLRPPRHVPRRRLDRGRARAPCRASAAVARNSLGQGSAAPRPGTCGASPTRAAATSWRCGTEPTPGRPS